MPDYAGNRCLARAFWSEVDTGSREENALKQKDRAFWSEVDTVSREENASKQKDRVPFRFNRNGKGSSAKATVASGSRASAEGSAADALFLEVFQRARMAGNRRAVLDLVVERKALGFLVDCDEI